jgi:hypothetical protein
MKYETIKDTDYDRYTVGSYNGWNILDNGEIEVPAKYSGFYENVIIDLLYEEWPEMYFLIKTDLINRSKLRR